MKKSRFLIMLTDELVNGNNYPPEDPLNELSSLERGLQRFFYENNYKVILKVHDLISEFPLYPDMKYTFVKYPIFLNYLNTQKEFLFEISEYDSINILRTGKDLTLTYSNSIITLDQGEFSSVVKKFVGEILNKSIEEGYINSQDQENFWKV